MATRKRKPAPYPRLTLKLADGTGRLTFRGRSVDVDAKVQTVITPAAGGESLTLECGINNGSIFWPLDNPEIIIMVERIFYRG